MARKHNVWSAELTVDPIEILPYNANRIKATIYFDGYNGNAALTLGMSGQSTQHGGAVYAYSYPIVVEGINPLWAAVAVGSGSPQNYTVIELVNE